MAIRTDTEIQTIQEYFSKRKEFYVPSYQRPYTWQVSNCEQLIEDIETHLENYDKDIQDNYFIGTILIAQDSDEDHETTLIDGQQRTTTFMLLLKALLIKIRMRLAELSSNSDDGIAIRKSLIRLEDAIIPMLYTLDDVDADKYEMNQYTLKASDLKYVNESISELYANDMQKILLAESLGDVLRSLTIIKYKKKENKYTNFYKNFKYFFDYFDSNKIETADFSKHFIDNCQIIAITSFNTDQAINIFNSLNGTGVPLTPIEVIVSKTTAAAKERKVFERNWQGIVEKTDNSSLNLNTLMTHYIFVKLSKYRGTSERNPGVRAFFKQNPQLLQEDVKFTEDLNRIIDNFNYFETTELSKILGQFNSNLKPFISSFLFYRKQNNRDLNKSTEKYISYLLRLGAILDLTEHAYSHPIFKGFLERINLKYSQTDKYTDDNLIEEIRMHIEQNFSKDAIVQTLKESGVPNSIIFLNEYVYRKNHSKPFDLYGNIDIEHVMPQSGLNRENIYKDAGFTQPEEFHEYAEKLGNKILLEPGINRGIGDAWFKTKKKRYLNSQYNIAGDLANYYKDTWVKEDIDLATVKAANRIADFLFE